MNDEERRAKVEEMLAWPLAEQFDAMDPLDRPFHQAQMVVRQRYAEMHDPGCGKGLLDRLKERFWDVAYPSADCDCWLSRCVLDSCDGIAAETGPQRRQRYAIVQAEGEWYDAPSTKIEFECTRCKQRAQICTNGHCMYCGSKS